MVNMWRGAVMVKICAVCGKEFKGRNCSKCCSVECQEELRKRSHNAYKKRQALRKLTGERPRDIIQPKRGNTLCWTCQNATGKCSWSARLEPVVGWKAKAIKVKGDSHTKKVLDSFIVKKCPKYIKDE